MTTTAASTLVLNRPQITLSGAQLLIANAHEFASQLGVSISVAIVDGGGELVAFERDDRSAPVTPQVALAKARTAALIKAPSKLFEDFINDGQPSFLSTPGITPLQGGIPLRAGDEVIGAIGISGGSGEQDAAIAIHAAEVLKLL